MAENTQNNAYLIREYIRNHISSYPVLHWENKTFIVPYIYTQKFATTDAATAAFKQDLTLFQKKEAQKYLSYGKVPFTIDVNGTEYLIPQNKPDMSIDDVIAQTLKKAQEQYEFVINAHRQLKDKKLIDFSQAAVKRYKHLLDSAEKEQARETMRATVKFFKNSGNVSLIATGNITEKGTKTAKKHKTKPFKYKPLLLSLLLTVAGGTIIKKTFLDNKEKTPIAPPHWDIYTSQIPKGETATTYIDFLGNRHIDIYGNLKRTREIMPKITAVILALEGYAEHSFNDKPDGFGTETVGSGKTVLIDENGNERQVKKGDTITPETDIINNIRYIDTHLLEALGDNMGRCLSDKEICTIIGAGYCWGTDGILNSNFLKSVKDREPLSTQIRKLTGFRTPMGLIKREALLGYYLSGEWTAKDLLDMPIYYYKDKGYVHCSIYTKDYSFYLPCKKDKKGNLIKNENNRDIPIICKDGYCKLFYSDADHHLLDSLKAETKQKKFKTVQDFMPTSYQNALKSISFDIKEELRQQPNFFNNNPFIR